MYRFCLECGWQANTEDGTTEHEVSRRAIEHFVETGHPVGSVRLPIAEIREN